MRRAYFERGGFSGEFKPDVVLGTGGYTTAAVLLAQWSRGGPVVIHEQNAVPGRTNRWLGRISSRVCVTYQDSKSFFPAAKVVVTGMPVRQEFASLLPKPAARRALGLAEGVFTILVVGGSQGAKRLNDLILGAWPLVDDGATQVLHQVGERNLAEVESRHVVIAEAYHVSAYIDMPLALAAADVVVARSGASTIAEVTSAGVPAVLIPYPHAYADHQRLNAGHVSDAGAAVLCEEGGASSEILADILKGLRASPDRLSTMHAASASLGRPDSAQRVAEVVRLAAEGDF